MTFDATRIEPTGLPWAERTYADVDEAEFRRVLETMGADGVSETADGSGPVIPAASFCRLEGNRRYYLLPGRTSQAQQVGAETRSYSRMSALRAL